MYIYFLKAWIFVSRNYIPNLGQKVKGEIIWLKDWKPTKSFLSFNSIYTSSQNKQRPFINYSTVFQTSFDLW